MNGASPMSHHSSNAVGSHKKLKEEGKIKKVILFQLLFSFKLLAKKYL
jgi:hypothetical protein